MFAMLKSDLLLKFVGGFVLGTIGILTLQPADARMASQTPAPSVAARMIDATL